MSAKISLDISQTDTLKKLLSAKFAEVGKKITLSAAERTVQHIVVDLIPAEPRPPVDRAMYKAGWRARPLGNGAMIENTLPYASIIEFGARAQNIKVGRAMLTALEGWVKRKGIVKGKGLDADVEARQMAWAIAMSMKKRGIFNEGKGLGILKKALKRTGPFLLEEFAAEIRKAFG